MNSWNRDIGTSGNLDIGLPAFPITRCPDDQMSRCPDLSSRFLHFLGQSRQDIEQIAYHAKIRDLEDGGFRVLIDGDDRARALHADDMLNRSADAHGQIKFGSDSLAGAADLAVHGQPARVADGAGGAKLPPPPPTPGPPPPTIPFFPVSHPPRN